MSKLVWTTARVQDLVAPFSTLVDVDVPGRRARLTLCCHACGAVWMVALNSLLRTGHVRGCPACVTGSFAEAWTLAAVEFLLGAIAERQARPTWLRSADACSSLMAYDGYFPDVRDCGPNGLIVEHHGAQHYDDEHYFPRNTQADAAKIAAAERAGARVIVISDLHPQSSWARHLCNCLEAQLPAFFESADRSARRDELLGGCAAPVLNLVRSRHTRLLEEVARRGHQLVTWSANYRSVTLACNISDHPSWTARTANYLPGTDRRGTGCPTCAVEQRAAARRLRPSEVDARALALGWVPVDSKAEHQSITTKRWWRCAHCGQTDVESAFAKLDAIRQCCQRPTREPTGKQSYVFEMASLDATTRASTWRAAAVRAGIATGTARRALREAGLLEARRRLCWTPADVALLRRAHALGETDAALVSRFGANACAQKRSELGLVNGSIGAPRSEKPWTETEISALRDRVSIEGVSALARFLGRPLHHVRRRIAVLGLQSPAAAKGANWSDSEDLVFAGTYTEFGAAAAAAALGRSIKAVTRRAETRGIRSGAMPSRVRRVRRA